MLTKGSCRVVFAAHMFNANIVDTPGRSLE